MAIDSAVTVFLVLIIDGVVIKIIVIQYNLRQFTRLLQPPIHVTFRK